MPRDPLDLLHTIAKVTCCTLARWLWLPFLADGDIIRRLGGTLTRPRLSPFLNLLFPCVSLGYRIFVLACQSCGPGLNPGGRISTVSFKNELFRVL
jgi:hypothetical protein